MMKSFLRSIPLNINSTLVFRVETFLFKLVDLDRIIGALILTTSGSTVSFLKDLLSLQELCQDMVYWMPKSNYEFKRINTTLKIGASNILDNLHIETVGGPFVGRLGYIKLNYQFDKK